jgi:hypothetical protein
MSDTGTPPPAAPPATPPPAEPPAPSATFTQAQLDAIVGDRLARERAKFEGFDDLKAKAAKLDEIEAASLSETERLSRELEAERASRTAAEQRATDALRRSSVVSAAQRAGAIDPDAVLALLPEGSVTVKDDGSVTGVDEAVSALLAAKPYLVGKPPTPTPGGADGGPRAGGASTTGTFSRSQLRDSVFYAANRAEIQRAVKAGNITND